MWQKFLYSGFLIVLSCMYSQVYAQTVEVCSVSKFSTENPPKSITVKLLEPLELTETLTLKAGTDVKGDLVDVVSPKRLKRDAGFSFKPVSYTGLNGKSDKLNNLNIIATYTTPVDKGELAKTVALGVGNYFVKGLSLGVAAVSGAVKDEEGNRIKSSAVSVYESSPLSLVEKGEDLFITPNQTFYLKFPDIKNVEIDNVQDNEVKGQNYSYTIEKE